jgi:hypothetical protein
VIHHAPGADDGGVADGGDGQAQLQAADRPADRGVAGLAELIAPARSRDSGNTILAKEFRGGVLVMTGANSAVGLRSMPVRYLFLDEVDGYPLDVDGEGDAISLAEARTRTFARRKIFIVSTPTICRRQRHRARVRSQRPAPLLRAVPALRHRQWLRFEQLRWEKGQPGDRGLHLRVLRDPIAEHHKTWMLEHGEWRAMARGKTAPAFTCRAVQPGRLAQLARHRRRLGERRQQGIGFRRRHQDLQEHRTRVRPGSRKAKRPTGSGWSSAARTTASARPAGRPAAGRRRRRAEGSHRSLDLGLRARQGVLAGRAPRADGRHRPRQVWKRSAALLARPGRTPRARRCRWRASRWIPALPRRKPTPSCAPAAIRG